MEHYKKTGNVDSLYAVASVVAQHSIQAQDDRSFLESENGVLEVRLAEKKIMENYLNAQHDSDIVRIVLFSVVAVILMFLLYYFILRRHIKNINVPVDSKDPNSAKYKLKLLLFQNRELRKELKAKNKVKTSS